MRNLKIAKFGVFVFALVIGGLFTMIDADSAEASCYSGNPSPGCEEWIDGPTYKGGANYNDCSSVYAWKQLQHGYVLVEYQDHRLLEYGRVTLAISEVLANGHSRSSFQDVSQFDAAIDAAYQQGLKSYAGRLEDRKDQYRAAIAESSSSHSKIEVRATVCGEGTIFDQKGGSLEGKLRLKVRYVGTPEGIRAEVNTALRGMGEPPIPDPNYQGFRVCNHSDSTKWVAYSSYDGTNYVSQGWYKVGPDTCKIVLNSLSVTRYIYLHWIGKTTGNINLCVEPTKAFTLKTSKSCYGSQRLVPFNTIDTGESSKWTANLY